MKRVALVVLVGASLLAAALDVSGADARSFWVGRAASNRQAELTVFDYELAAVPERPGRLRVTVATGWRNLAAPQKMTDIEWKTTGVGSLASFGRSKPPRGREALQHVAYLVPRLSDHLYLMAGNGHVARTHADREVRLPRQGDEAEVIVVFEVDARDAEAMLLVFFDFDHGHLTVPLTSRLPPREGSAPLSEAANDYVRARVYGSRREADAFIVEIGLVSTSAGNAVEVDLDGAIGLARPDGSVVEPLAGPEPDRPEGPERLLPEWESRRLLVFPGPLEGDPGAIEIALPGQDPLRLPLVAGAPVVPAVAALAAWEDGEGLRLEVLRVEHSAQAGSIGLRVRVVNRSGSDLTFSPAEQFQLFVEGRALRLEPRGDEGEDTWIVRDGATRVLDLQYRQKRPTPRAELRYRGFEQARLIKLEVSRR